MNVPTRSRSAAHEHLRTATSAGHRAAEEALDLAGSITVDVHRRALELLLAVFGPVEDVLADWHLSHPDGWQVQPRSSLAAADLRQLPHAADGAAAPSWPVLPPKDGAVGAPEALGYAYALEGSRLGGAVIGRRIAADRPGAPASFFCGAERGRWRAFLLVLDETLPDERARERAAHAAGSVFDELVAQAGRRPRG